MKAINIGKYEISSNSPVFIIAEIGINHNGDMDIVKKLIKSAKDSGCDAVKFQKRTVEVVYTSQELKTLRKSPFGETNGDLKRGLELSLENYEEIDKYCKELDIIWFASPWDEASVDFLEGFNVPCYKIASASLTDAGLLARVKSTKKPVLMSVGMSNETEIQKAVDILGKDRLVLLYCKCIYPPAPEQINLNAMRYLMELYPDIPIGYSGHEFDTIISMVAVSLGARIVERHFTLDREMWGSDQKSSIEPETMKTLVKNIRTAEKSMGSPELRCLIEEEPIKTKLRRVDNI